MKEKTTPTPTPEENVAQEGAQAAEKVFILLGHHEDMAGPEVRAIHRGMHELFPEEGYEIQVVDPETKAVGAFRRFKGRLRSSPAQEGSQGMREWLKEELEEAQREIVLAVNKGARSEADGHTGRAWALEKVLERVGRWTPPPGDRSGEVAQRFELDEIYRHEPRALRTQDDRPLGPRELMDHYCGDDVCEHGTRLYEDCERCTPPAPPPAAAPAEETSSGGERCTAGGAGSYCLMMRYALRAGFILPGGYASLVQDPPGSDRGPFWVSFFTFCPWCGEKLGGEG